MIPVCKKKLKSRVWCGNLAATIKINIQRQLQDFSVTFYIINIWISFHQTTIILNAGRCISFFSSSLKLTLFKCIWIEHAKSKRPIAFCICNWPTTFVDQPSASRANHMSTIVALLFLLQAKCPLDWAMILHNCVLQKCSCDYIQNNKMKWNLGVKPWQLRPPPHFTSRLSHQAWSYNPRVTTQQILF